MLGVWHKSALTSLRQINLKAYASWGKMKKATTLTILASLLLGSLTLASDDPAESSELKYGRIAQNAVYAEIYGNSVAYSVNYERVFLNKRPFFLTCRGGVGYFSSRYSVLSFPVLINGLYQIKYSWFGEFGLGTTFLSRGGGPFHRWPTGIVGLRYQGQRGLFGTAAWTPHYDPTENFANWFFVGATLGFAF